MDYFDFFNPKAKTTNMVKSPTYYDFSDSLPHAAKHRKTFVMAFIRVCVISGKWI